MIKKIKFADTRQIIYQTDRIHFNLLVGSRIKPTSLIYTAIFQSEEKDIMVADDLEFNEWITDLLEEKLVIPSDSDILKSDNSGILEYFNGPIIVESYEYSYITKTIKKIVDSLLESSKSKDKLIEIQHEL